ncbi:MAG: DUF4468 domain-containing protein [Tannerellaceae bacterium]|nr:DUF4468 domain-containing protein [Tannerellaceae bacterium]
MKQLLLILALIPTLLFAQKEITDKYLSGAVTEEEEKVVFTREIDTRSLSPGQTYQLINKWLEEQVLNENTRIVYSDEAKGDIVVTGEEYLVFSRTALSLDRTLASYRLFIHCRENECILKLGNLRYQYNVSYQKEPEKYVAEEWITDKYALSRGKLNRISGKFRVATIDFADLLFEGATAFLGTALLSTPTPVKAIQEPGSVPQPQEETIPISSQGTSSGMEGYRQISPDRIPGNIIKMLTEDWMLITAGNSDGMNMMTASWGGLGSLFSKPVAFCFIKPERYTYQLMEKNDTYTFTFYTEAYRDVLQYAGSNSGRDKDKVQESGLTPVFTPGGTPAFNEAWMIIECRKILSQPLDPALLNDNALYQEWKNNQLHTMYVGEIINVWIK